MNLNNEINSVTGLAVAFYPLTRNTYYRRIYKSFKDASVDLNNPEKKRVEYHMSPYAVTGLYGMNRTHVFKKISKLLKFVPHFRTQPHLN